MIPQRPMMPPMANLGSQNLQQKLGAQMPQPGMNPMQSDVMPQNYINPTQMQIPFDPKGGMQFSLPEAQLGGGLPPQPGAAPLNPMAQLQQRPQMGLPSVQPLQQAQAQALRRY